MTAVPPSCGELGPRIAGGAEAAAPALCSLVAGHAGMHRADDGMEWRLVPTSSDRVASTPAPQRLRVGRSVGRTIYDADTDELVGVMDSSALAAELVELWNGSR